MAALRPTGTIEAVGLFVVWGNKNVIQRCCVGRVVVCGFARFTSFTRSVPPESSHKSPNGKKFDRERERRNSKRNCPVFRTFTKNIPPFQNKNPTTAVQIYCSALHDHWLMMSQTQSMMAMTMVTTMTPPVPIEDSSVVPSPSSFGPRPRRVSIRTRPYHLLAIVAVAVAVAVVAVCVDPSADRHERYYYADDVDCDSFDQKCPPYHHHHHSYHDCYYYYYYVVHHHHHCRHFVAVDC